MTDTPLYSVEFYFKKLEEYANSFANLSPTLTIPKVLLELTNTQGFTYREMIALRLPNVIVIEGD